MLGSFENNDNKQYKATNKSSFIYKRYLIDFDIFFSKIANETI